MDPGEQQFFEQGEQPIEEVPEEPKFVAEPLAVRVRRARLRRIVGAILLASVALCAAGLLVGHNATRARRQLAVQTPSRRAMLNALLPTAVTEPQPVTSSNAPLATASPSVVAVPSVSSERSELIRRARVLLEAGHTREGVTAARLAVDANGSDAEPYILLAAGLQDEGRWAEAQSVFNLCKQKTRSGPNATCHYFAGH